MNVLDYFDLLKSRQIPVVIDDDKFRPCMAELGFASTHFDDHDLLAEQKQPTFMLLTQLSFHDRLMELWQKSANIVSHVALAKFDNSPRCVEYSLRHLLSIDYPDTLRRRNEYYDKIVACKGIEVETSAGILTCSLNEEIELANTDMELKPGWMYSAAEFLEASVVNVEKDRSSFSLEGKFAFSGLIYLCNNEQLREQFGAALAELVERSTRGDNRLEMSENKIDRFVVGGADMTVMLHELLKERERETSATEFAIGCVEFPHRQDWTINSLMHESSHGVHVGVGMARQIPHLDFIAKGATCRFLD